MNSATKTNKLAAWQILAIINDLGYNALGRLAHWRDNGNWKFDVRYGTGNANEIIERINKAIDLGYAQKEGNSGISLTELGTTYWVANCDGTGMGGK